MTSRFNIGKSLRKMQAEQRVSNIELANELGVNPVQVARWRNSSDMKFSRVAELAGRFKMTVEEFANQGL